MTFATVPFGGSPFGAGQFQAPPDEDAPPPAPPTRVGGSWWSLRDIAVEARQYHQALMLAGLQACPYDGEPLQMGAPRAQGQRHCRVCGRLYR